MEHKIILETCQNDDREAKIAMRAYFALVHFSLKVIASSGGRSTMMNPFAPASAASWMALSSP